MNPAATPRPTADPAVPVRTCIGCRRRAPAPELLRFVARGQVLRLDARGGAAGRGAHLHPGCLGRVGVREFSKALRTQITDAADALAQASTQHERTLQDDPTAAAR